jgi:hypothetical protein
MNDIDRAMKLMRIFVATIESLDREQVELLISGKVKLTVIGPKKTKEAGTGLVDEIDILNKLNNCRDRTVAREILSAIRTRDALAAFARILKVHVVKHDRREDIESKIVEFVIGGKLRTEAISSLNLKGVSGRPSDDEPSV